MRLTLEEAVQCGVVLGGDALGRREYPALYATECGMNHGFVADCVLAPLMSGYHCLMMQPGWVVARVSC